MTKILPENEIVNNMILKIFFIIHEIQGDWGGAPEINHNFSVQKGYNSHRSKKIVQMYTKIGHR